MAMFGLIVSGRLVQTDFQPISEIQFVITIPEADRINHVVVFLTGAVPFPEGTAGQVYFSWPDPNAPPKWQPLGHISNQKPSAIYKISTLKKLDEMAAEWSTMFGQSHIVHHAQIGIAIEPLTHIQADMSPNNAINHEHFGQKMLENFMNFVCSYSLTQQQMMPDPSATFVPLSSVQKWYENFRRRLLQNPNFWKT